MEFAHTQSSPIQTWPPEIFVEFFLKMDKISKTPLANTTFKKKLYHVTKLAENEGWENFINKKHEVRLEQLF